VSINGAAVDTHRQHVLAKGDVVTLSTPGGGGYGPPEGRSAALRERDRLLGYLE
jgi:N-methylhydantoinase B